MILIRQLHMEMNTVMFCFQCEMTVSKTHAYIISAMTDIFRGM